MASKVLTNLPDVTPRGGKGGLICAGHSVAPERLPPGVVTMPCHRCGRPVIFGRTPYPPDGEPATEFAVHAALPQAEAEEAERTAVVTGVSDSPGAEEVADIPIDLDAEVTPAVVADAPPAAYGPETLEFMAKQTREMPAVNITAEDLEELEVTRQTGSHARAKPPPPVPLELESAEATDADEPTTQVPAPPRRPRFRRTESR